MVMKESTGDMHVKDMWPAHAQQIMRQNTRHARTTHKQIYLAGKAKRDDCTTTYSAGAQVRLRRCTCVYGSHTSIWLTHIANVRKRIQDVPVREKCK